MDKTRKLNTQYVKKRYFWDIKQLNQRSHMENSLKIVKHIKNKKCFHSYVL